MHSQSATLQSPGLCALCPVELSARPAVAVVVAGHDHDGLLAAGEVPERGQRHLVAVHLLDEVDQQSLLLVGLRDLDLVQVDPVGLDVPGP